MNTRFSFSFIRHLHTRRQGGMSMVFALGIGLVVLTTAVVMIMRAQGDQSQSASQAVMNQAIAAAEAGATRYVEFLNNNRGLIPYDSCTVVNTATGVCSDSTASTTTANSWVTASAASGHLPGIGAGTTPVSIGGSSPSCSSTGGTGGTPPANYQTVSSDTITSQWANPTGSGGSGGWRDLSNGTKYRLVSYKVIRTDPADPATTTSAKVTIEGQSGNGKARIQFIVPVSATTVPSQESTSSSSTGFPVIWAQNFNFGSNNSANGQVWDSSNCLSGGTAMPDARILNFTNNKNGLNVLPTSPLTLASGVTDTPSANNGNNQLYDGTVYRASSSAANPLPKVLKTQAFPNLPSVSGTDAATYPTSSTPKLVYGPDTTQTGTITENSLDCSNLSNVTFPRDANDKSSTNVAYGTAPSDATYVYRCSGGMTIGGSNVNLGRSGNETIVFYVNGTFNASSNGGIFPVQDTSDQSWSRGIFYVKNDAQVKANGNVGRLLAPFALQFYVYNSANMNPGYDMGGNGSLYAFVFAPTSVGLSKGTEDLGGAIWIKSFEVDGNNKLWQGIFDDTKLMVKLPVGGSVTTYGLGGTASTWGRTSLDTQAVPGSPSVSIASSVVQPSVYWNATARATAYTLYRCEGSSANPTCAPGTPIKAYTTPPSSGTPYVEASLPSAVGRRWCYAAVASNDGGDAKGSTTCGAFR